MSDRNISPSRRSSSARSRTSLQGSPTIRPKSSSTPIKKSPSPSRKRSPSNKSLSPSRSGSKGKKSPSRVQSPPKTPKDGRRSASGKKTPKSQTSKSPDLTEKGLKIVDLSGQGMTSIPSSLLTTKDIGELCVSSNNLRSLPTDIKRLTSLTKLDLSKNGLRCSHPQDYGGLPSEMEQLKDLVDLRISECNLPFVPPVIWKLTSLKTLDVSRNKINILLPEIGNLTQLQHVNLQQTNISSLPPEIAFCQELEEILLWGNSIESLPETLTEIPKLKTLAINYRSFCGVVDGYMENLLRKGQIKSEHIPIVVFELPALECLDLENTKLNNLPDVYNIGLQEFYLCRNFLQSIPESIYNLKYLTILDLSHNLMMSIPEDIGRLRSLKTLKLNHNMFEKVPPTIGLLLNMEELNMSGNRIRRLPPEIRGLAQLKTLLLEDNNIQCLPDEICDLTELETLDVTNNSIKHLPMKLYNLSKLTVAHCYRKLHKYGLWLYKNPLEQPPSEIWRTEKPEQIFDYLKKLQIICTENLQRQKILVLGESQAGKTSLVKTLAFKKSNLTNGASDRTRVLQQKPWKTENNVEFMFNDFGGDDTYLVTTPLFLDSKALVLLVYNCSRFSPERYQKMVGRYINMLNIHAPGAVVKLVATQCDLLEDTPEKSETTATKDRDGEKRENGDKEEDEKKEEEEDKTQNVQKQEEKTHDMIVLTAVQKQLKDYQKWVVEEINLIEREQQKLQKSTCGKSANEVEEAAQKLLQVRHNKLKEVLGCPVRVLPQVAIVSSSVSLEGIADLVDETEHLAIDKILFPHAQRYIPGSWDRLRATLKQQKSYCLLWDEVEQLASDYKIKGAALEECIYYLHDVGEVLWYSDVTGLSEILFHRPRVLVDILAAIYRHDIEEFMDFETNKIFGSKGGLTSDEFTWVREIFLKYGQISRPLLNCLWFYQKMDNSTLLDLLELLPLLDLCYAVPEPDIPTCRLYCRPLMVVPWYNRDNDIDDLVNIWPIYPKDNEKELSVIYSFPFYFPIGLFDKIAAAIQDLVLSRIDWNEVVYATSDNEKILIRKLSDPKPETIKIFVRGLEFGSIQELMKEFVQVINSMLIRYPGLYWTLDIPMKNVEFLSFVTMAPTVRFESAKTTRSLPVSTDTE